MWTVYPSVMLNTSESFGTCLLIDSVKCGISTKREFHIMKKTCTHSRISVKTTQICIWQIHYNSNCMIFN